MLLDKIGQAVSNVVHKVADTVADTVADIVQADPPKPAPAPKPELPADSTCVSGDDRLSGYSPAAPAQIQPAATPSNGAVDSPNAPAQIDDLVYRPGEDGPVEPNPISYTPGRESGSNGPIKVAGDPSQLPLPGRGNRRPQPPTVFV